MYNIFQFGQGAIEHSTINWMIIIPAAISILTLIFNFLFYIIIAPHINFKFQKKAEFYKVAADLLNLLSEIISYKDFSDVPTKVRKYSLSIHILFKSGTAPEPLADLLEQLFQSTKQRKTILEESEIIEWEHKFRDLVRMLRKEMSKYTGIF